VALTDDTTISYLCSETYNPSAEHTVHPLDPRLGIEWPVDTPILSARDAAAPTLDQAMEQGLLPDYQVCLDYAAKLRRAHE
jgi:dTDP-4-dehydrorhamnose 3,5-epimerase